MLDGDSGGAVMGSSIALDGEYLYATVGIALWAASIEVDCFPTARQREWFPYLDAPWPREPHVYPDEYGCTKGVIASRHFSFEEGCSRA